MKSECQWIYRQSGLSPSVVVVGGQITLLDRIRIVVVGSHAYNCNKSLVYHNAGLSPMAENQYVWSGDVGRWNRYFC